VDRYENLVYSIVRGSEVEPSEEVDVSQAVWIDIYRQLDKLREPEALGSWIGTITRHKCYHWGRTASRRPLRAWNAKIAAHLVDPAPSAEEWLEEIVRRQEVQEAIDSLPPRCRRLLTALFLDDPPRPYAEVAARLRVPVGSISTIRMNCLDRLKQVMIQLDLR
jgi:RNA polymerase sigma factor (sigma-70 family)